MSKSTHSIALWQHKHDFSQTNNHGERNTLYVLYLTVITMLVEIIAGTVYGSMALLADGWHMGTHAAAFLITLFAYYYARKNKDNPRFAFGTGKVSVLGGFSSAITLGLVALIMAVESVLRLFNPEQIHFQEAILVATLGLLVNVVSVFLLKDSHSHSHEHPHAHEEHAHRHEDDGQTPAHDHNLRAAYFHVLADALTSILAITALLMGQYFALNSLDPIIGIVGAIIISRWSWGLLKQMGPILLDKSIDTDYQAKIIKLIEDKEDHQVADIHIWSISADHYGAVISIVSHHPFSVEYYRNLLTPFTRLSHLTIEVNTCTQVECLQAH
ncbi:CDF family Co(II)/Ni(II) efflux transporter DmeF [Psychromonas antarctica]|uniref:CDF family Co(II)/Ni(II) efflux transporter DmeF n=1 Tax=Psychromonas antarctica TaxID=67573 RepID=UPI001EE951B1|nr:CDF family Co(II)/Ni(II) efflux transporter DmeF [Psychromonas antarctica]MCG6200756.1 CDF family Co(II)/Ni(II) efflux transporter DmeF [Psychromonas antarctica]